MSQNQPGLPSGPGLALFTGLGRSPYAAYAVGVALGAVAVTLLVKGFVLGAILAALVAIAAAVAGRKLASAPRIVIGPSRCRYCGGPLEGTHVACPHCGVRQ